ncbi:MAG: PEP-CTERM sorting domain-containing protein [Chthoniobacteraceae bacterium]
MTSLPARTLSRTALRWSLLAASALTLDASAALVDLRNSIDGYQTDYLRGFANLTTNALGGFFAYIPISITPPEDVKLTTFRGIGWGYGPAAHQYVPNFGGFVFALNVWSSQAAVMTNPEIGDLYRISLPQGSDQYPTFTPYGIGPAADGMVNNPTFEMKIDDLASLNLNLEANHTYYIGVYIQQNQSESDWRWSESNEQQPSDTVISTSFGSPWGTRLASSFGSNGIGLPAATTGRMALAVVAQTVPEPGTVVTLLLGASALGACRRRRSEPRQQG